MSAILNEDFNGSNFGVLHHILKQCKSQGVDILNNIDPDDISVKCSKASAGARFELEEIITYANNFLMVVIS